MTSRNSARVGRPANTSRMPTTASTTTTAAPTTASAPPGSPRRVVAAQLTAEHQAAATTSAANASVPAPRRPRRWGSPAPGGRVVEQVGQHVGAVDRDAEHRARGDRPHVGHAPPPAATATTGSRPNATTKGATDQTVRFSPASYAHPAATSTTCADRGDRAEEQADEDRHRRGDERRGPDGRHRDQPAGDRLVAPADGAVAVGVDPVVRQADRELPGHDGERDDGDEPPRVPDGGGDHGGEDGHRDGRAGMRRREQQAEGRGPSGVAHTRERTDGRLRGCDSNGPRRVGDDGARAVVLRWSGRGDETFGFRTYFVAAPLSNSS